MKRSLEILYENKQNISILILITSYLDYFSGNNDPGENKKQYIKLLKEEFPHFIKSPFLNGKQFYENYRCKAVHNFFNNTGYAIANSHEIKGESVSKIKCNGKTYVALNIDLLYERFMEFIDTKLNKKSIRQQSN